MPQAAGLTSAPSPLASMLIAGFAGQAAARTQAGKYRLMAGLLASVGRMALMAWSAHADTGRWVLLPGEVLAGLRIGRTRASRRGSGLKPSSDGVSSMSSNLG